MRLVRTVIGTALVVGLALTPVHAAPKGPKVSKAPKATKAVSAPKSPKASTGPKAPKATTTKTVAAKPTKTKTNPGLAKKSTASTTVTAKSDLAPTGTIDFTEGKVGERLTRNSALRSKLEAQLLALGYEGTVYQAAYGFKNQGQLVAAVNNAQNHSLSFEQLKTLMTGLSVDPTTGAVLHANLNPDGTVTMVPVDEVTNPAPTQSLGQAKQTIAQTATETETTATTVGN